MIDNTLYSRQLYTIGKDAMESINSSNIYISGMAGLGVEIAKNLILYGVKSVTINDNNKIKLNDLSSNYYAQTKDIGKNRAEVVYNKLKELNHYVEVKINNELLCEEIIKSYDVIIICDKFIKQCIYYNMICRKHNIKFIMVNTIGLTGVIFCDFGKKFIINDIDGETPLYGIITEIKNNIYVCGEPHQLYVGDVVKIKLESEKEIIEITDSVIKVINQFSFIINETILIDTKLINSSFTQIKQSKKIRFLPIEQSSICPEFSSIFTDDFERQQLLHCFNLGLYIFIKQFGRLPNKWNNVDAYSLIDFVGIEMSNIFKCELTEYQKNIIKKLSYTCQGKLCPIDSIFGSIVAQEVIKGVTKKYTPINQWLHMDFTDLLSDDMSEYLDFNCESRYSGQINIFGKKIQEKINNSNIFIVGAGAIGCELAKNMAMIGIGNITITDMDKIEKSNLNRQFLFRNSDIGNFKSESLKKSILKMNKDINVTAQINKIGQETLNIYDNVFFNKIDCVMTALDNIDARLFVDKLCVESSKALIDSGTLGTKGNIQCVIPYLTQSYGATKDPEEKAIPLCTLKNFPYLIEHCIQWSRDLFEGFFVRIPENYKKFIDNPENIKSMSPSELLELYEDVIFINENNVCHSKECIKFAYKMWHLYFRDHIEHLIAKYPIDHLTDEGNNFWSGTRKFPKIFKFRSTELNISFLMSVANLWADVFGLDHVNNIQINDFLKKTKIPIITKPKNNNESKIDHELIIEELLELKDIKYDVHFLEFEKDDDTNFHIDFVNDMSNLRALNYGIEQVDKFKTKGIAGKIIPAIVTTTSLVSGFACIQMLKVLQNINKIENYKNVYINLALPFIALSEPIEIKSNMIGLYESNIWKKLKFNDIKLYKLIDTILKLTNLDFDLIDYISYDKYTLYDSEIDSHEDRLGMKISEIFQYVVGENLKTIMLTIFLDSKVEEIIEPIYCIIDF
jgi:ubiquitin-activating enzyme E1